MLACSEQQLIRTYPKGVRFDSSNYSPIPMWTCGMQLVALNWQYPGTSSAIQFIHANSKSCMFCFVRMSTMVVLPALLQIITLSYPSFLLLLSFRPPDVSMHLNQGLFRLNGGCGYVLKPEVMRKPSSAGGED